MLKQKKMPKEYDLASRRCFLALRESTALTKHMYRWFGTHEIYSVLQKSTVAVSFIFMLHSQHRRKQNSLNVNWITVGLVLFCCCFCVCGFGFFLVA